MFPILRQVPRPQSPTFLGIKGINTHPFFLNIKQMNFTPCLGAYRPPTLRVFVTSVVRCPRQGLQFPLVLSKGACWVSTLQGWLDSWPLALSAELPAG